MEIKKENYKYLIKLYLFVSEYLSTTPDKEEDLAEVVCSFCVFAERIFKIRLYKENPVLVFDNCKIKENDALIAVVKRNIDLNIDTIKIRELLCRYNLMFNNEFSDDETPILLSIYDIRNHLFHGYKADNIFFSDKEDIIKKMGTFWERIEKQAISIFGKEAIKESKPEKKYTKQELEKVLEDEVKKKINRGNHFTFEFDIDLNRNTYSPFSLNREKCPRCGSYDFSNDIGSHFGSITLGVTQFGEIADLYKCKKCNLELTKKEYQIAKKIKCK